MKTKHAPGPWMHDRRWIVLDGGRKCLAEVYSGPCTYLSEADANGRLIAAAPELLEALLVFCRQDPADVTPEFCLRVDELLGRLGVQS